MYEGCAPAVYGPPKVSDGGQLAVGVPPIHWVPGGGACSFCHLRCRIFQVVAVHLLRDLDYFRDRASKIQH